MLLRYGFRQGAASNAPAPFRLRAFAKQSKPKKNASAQIEHPEMLAADEYIENESPPL